MIAVLLLTPRVVEAMGGVLGIGSPWVELWNVARWALLAVLAELIIMVLYYFTSNIVLPRFRLVTEGSLVAFGGWVVTTVAFGFYATNISQYDRIYGWLGGGIALLLWLYPSNLVFVMSAELDIELLPVRQLRSGIAAETTVRLTLRDTSRSRLSEPQARAGRGRGARTAQTPHLVIDRRRNHVRIQPLDGVPCALPGLHTRGVFAIVIVLDR